MAIADSKVRDLCGAKASYGARNRDPHYLATYDETESCDPIGIAVLCSECNKTHKAVIFLRDAKAKGEE